MHQENTPTQDSPKYACYDPMYDQIYDAAYGVIFTFYDEDEELGDISDSWLPTNSTTFFRSGNH